MRRVVDYNCESVGYFSQVHVVDGNVDPVYRRMHIEELKKINGIDGYEKTPFDCDKPVEDWGGVTSAKPLVDFLIGKGVISEQTHQFNVICRSSVLTMLYMAPRDRSKKVSVRYEGRNIILEEIEETSTDYNPAPLELTPSSVPNSSCSKNDNVTEGGTNGTNDTFSTTTINLSPHTGATYAGYYADIHLTKAPVEHSGDAGKLEKSNLYVVVKHRYVYDDGTIVNLFVSKEIDAVEFNEEGEEKVSIDLKVGRFHMFANTEVLEFKSTKPILMGFLSGGLSYIHGIMLEDKKIQKVTVMDSLSAVCNVSFLNEFKWKLSDFLFALIPVSSQNLVKRIEVHYKHVVLINSTGSLYIHRILTRKWHDFRQLFTYDPEGPHYLIIVGSIRYPMKLENPLYPTDVVTVDNYCRKLYNSFMCEPQNIFVHGKKDELMKVKEAMSEDELAKTEFVEVK